jgi:hypothetical protein
MTTSPRSRETEDKLTETAAEIRRLIGSMYFDPTWDLATFYGLVDGLARVQRREDSLLQWLIIELGSDEARLLAALRRAYQVQVKP